MTNLQEQRSRNWSVTIKESDATREELLKAFAPFSFIGQKEKGKESGYEHWQLFVQGKNAIKFKQLKDKFPTAHLEVVKGSTQQMYDYVTKSSTKVPGGEISHGEMKLSNRGAIKKSIEDLREEISSGRKLSDIIVEENLTPQMVQSLEIYRDALMQKTYGSCFRNVETTFIYGPTGSGKTRSVYDKYGYEDVYVVGNYKNPWDGYEQQPIVLMDEFYNSLPVDGLLRVLDGHPLKLQARYHDRVAAYNKVFIISNANLEDNFYYMNFSSEDQRDALLRRITNVYLYDYDGIHDKILDKEKVKAMKKWAY